jgi:hypothetical protein
MIGWYRVLIQVAIFLGRVGRQAYAALGGIGQNTLILTSVQLPSS